MVMCTHCTYGEENDGDTCLKRGHLVVVDSEGMISGCIGGKRKPDEIYLDKVEL